MKKPHFFDAKRYLFAGTLMLAAVFMVSCDKDDDDKPDPANARYTITGTANGQQLTPAVEGSGSASFNGTYDSSNRQLIFTSAWTNLSGAPTSASFYTGQTGASGTPIGSAWTFDPSAAASGTYTDTITVSSDQVQALLNGNWYYIYNTGTNANGEIRGQLAATRQ